MSLCVWLWKQENSKILFSSSFSHPEDHGSFWGNLDGTLYLALDPEKRLGSTNSLWFINKCCENSPDNVCSLVSFPVSFLLSFTQHTQIHMLTSSSTESSMAFERQWTKSSRIFYDRYTARCFFSLEHGNKLSQLHDGRTFISFVHCSFPRA